MDVNSNGAGGSPPGAPPLNRRRQAPITHQGEPPTASATPPPNDSFTQAALLDHTSQLATFPEELRARIIQFSAPEPTTPQNPERLREQLRARMALGTSSGHYVPPPRLPPRDSTAFGDAVQARFGTEGSGASINPGTAGNSQIIDEFSARQPRSGSMQAEPAAVGGPNTYPLWQALESMTQSASADAAVVVSRTLQISSRAIENMVQNAFGLPNAESQSLQAEIARASVDLWGPDGAPSADLIWQAGDTIPSDLRAENARRQNPFLSNGVGGDTDVYFRVPQAGFPNPAPADASTPLPARLAWLNRALPRHWLRVPGFSVKRYAFDVPEVLRSSAAWRGEWKVKFAGEDGSDYGGVTQDWLTQMLRGCTEASNGILQGRGTDKAQHFLHPTLAGALTLEMTQKLELLGRLVAKAMTQRLPCPEMQLAPRLLARLTGRDMPRGLAGLAAIDRDVAKSLTDILAYPEAQLLAADLPFEASDANNPQGPETPLRPDQPELTVTLQNRETFVEEKAQRILDSYDDATEAFVRAFHEIIPERLVTPFSTSELDHILGGERFVDAQDWRKNTWVSSDGSWEPTKNPATHPETARWFFEIVDEFSQEERKKLLWLVTDASAPPAMGFAKLEPSFTIHVGADAVAPFGSHTCFNKLDLPKYESKAALKADLDTWLQSSGKFNAS